jgi:pilus assembly protein CpaE
MDIRSSKFAPPGFRDSTGEKALALLSTEEISRAAYPGPDIAGFSLQMAAADPQAPLDPAALADARMVLIEVDPASPRSISRLGMAARLPIHPFVVAAVRDPTLAQVRQLLREGAQDVIGLPLLAEEVEGLLVQLRAELDASRRGAGTRGKLVSIVKAVGGVGATAIATQLACLFAEQEAQSGRTACLIDLDLQFGNAAMYLGENPKLTVQEVLEAGARVDGAFLKAVTAAHASGLAIIAAPQDMMPLEAVDTDQVCEFVEIASREYGTLFLDLPGNWTNWSLSLATRSDLVLLVTELSVPSLRQARRQLNLLRQQGSADLDVRIVLNRYEKGLFRALKLEDAVHVLGHSVDFTVANDFPVVSAALDQGVRLTEIKARNRVSRDLTNMAAGVAQRLYPES